MEVTQGDKNTSGETQKNKAGAKKRAEAPRIKDYIFQDRTSLVFFLEKICAIDKMAVRFDA